MGEDRCVYRVLVGKRGGKRPLGRPGEDGRILLKCIFRNWDGEGMDLIDLAQVTDSWWTLVNAVMNFRFL
jgi:hypothetical protein